MHNFLRFATGLSALTAAVLACTSETVAAGSVSGSGNVSVGGSRGGGSVSARPGGVSVGGRSGGSVTTDRGGVSVGADRGSVSADRGGVSVSGERGSVTAGLGGDLSGPARATDQDRTTPPIVQRSFGSGAATTSFDSMQGWFDSMRVWFSGESRRSSSAHAEAEADGSQVVEEEVVTISSGPSGGMTRTAAARAEATGQGSATAKAKAVNISRN
jgi:hypothetical protein